MASYLLAAILVTLVTLTVAYDDMGRGGHKRPYYSQPQTYPVPIPYPVQQQSGCGGCGCGCGGRRRRDTDQTEIAANNNGEVKGEDNSMPPEGFVKMIYPNGATVLVPLAVTPKIQDQETKIPENSGEESIAVTDAP